MGWVPHPKAAKTLFNNALLPAFYEAAVSVPDDRVFKKEFFSERNRAFELDNNLNQLERKLEFIRGENPAAAGRFLEEKFKIKSRHDIVTCESNIEKIQSILTELNKNMEVIQGHDNLLYRADGMRVKKGQELKHAFNMKAKTRVTNMMSAAENDRSRLEAALRKLKIIFGMQKEEEQVSRKNILRKQAKRKLAKKKALRREKQEKMVMEAIFVDSQLCVDAVARLNHQQGTCLESLLLRIPVTPDTQATILANLSEPARKGYQTAHLHRHATCTEGCEAADCPFYSRAAALYRSLGGQTYGNMCDPTTTGLPQLHMADLDRDVFDSIELDTPEFTYLSSVGCFAEEVGMLLYL